MAYLPSTLQATGQGNFSHANSIGQTLSGNLTASGADLFQRDLSISGALQTAITTASVGVNALNGLSGAIALVGISSVSVTTSGTNTVVISGAGSFASPDDLTTTGATLFQRDLTISGALRDAIATAAAGVNEFNGLSGALTLAGAGGVGITTSGASTIFVSGTSTLATTSNLTTTGNTLFQRDLTISGAIEGRIGATGQAVLTAANSYTNSVGTNLSGNLTVSGATLFQRDLTISGGLQANIAATGSNAVQAAYGFATSIGSTISGNLTQSGIALMSRDTAISGALSTTIAATGQAALNAAIAYTNSQVGAFSSSALSLPLSESVGAYSLVNLWNDAGTVKVRYANAATTGTEAVGIVTTTGTAPSSINVYFAGVITGLSGLTPGWQWLSLTNGQPASSPPTGSANIVQPVGFAASSGTLMLRIERPIVL